MIYGLLKIKINGKPYVSIILNFTLMLILGIATAVVIDKYFWGANTSISHTILELICIFIALSIFFVIWHNFERNSPGDNILGIGFFIVAVFDMVHTYFYPSLRLHPEGFVDLSTRYWLIGRFTEGLILILALTRIFKKSINKWLGLFIAAAITIITIGAFYYLKDTFPVLFTEKDGLTVYKIVTEYIIIALFIVSLILLRNSLNLKDIFTYRYIFISLLIAIPTGLCFTLFDKITSFYCVLGHVLKIVYYYYLFRGIYVSAIEYPYTKLEEKKSNMSEILSASPIGILTFDGKLRINFANRKALEILGVCEDSILGMALNDAVKKFHCAGNAYAGCEIKGILEPVFNYTVTVKRDSGITAKLAVDVFGLEKGGYVCLFDEIKKKQEMENLQLQTQTILNSIENTVALVDKSDNIIMCNKAFENAFGTNCRDYLDLHRDISNDIPQAAGLKSKYNDKRKDKETFELSYMTPEGSKKELIVQKTPVYNVDGEIIGHMEIGTDVTDIKIRHRKLQQQEKLALLGQMSASIVHETKNYLASIKGCCQLINLKAKDEGIRKYVSKIENITDDINTVVIDFLDMSKPRMPAFEEVSLNELVKSMRFMLQGTLFSRTVDIQMEITPKEKPVLCDKAQIKQVILNLTRNAFEAMEETEYPRLEIKTLLSNDSNIMMIIISDNGKGISEEVMGKIGTPFFTTKENGTGLGLSVCYRIIKDHRGNIDIKSKKGMGTTFIISLPCRVKARSVSA